MSRIRLLNLDEMESDIAELCTGIQQATGDSTAIRAIAHRPDIVRSFVQFYAPLQTQGIVSRKLLELVRLAIAQINQCQNCLQGRYQDSIDEGLTEEMIAALPAAETSSLFTEREKAAISYGQKMASNHFSLGDDDFIQLHQHFSEPELVELIMNVAMFVGIGRLFAVLDATNTVCVIPSSVNAA